MDTNCTTSPWNATPTPTAKCIGALFDSYLLVKKNKEKTSHMLFMEACYAGVVMRPNRLGKKIGARNGYKQKAE